MTRSVYKWLSYPVTTNDPVYGGCGCGLIVSRLKSMKMGDVCNQTQWHINSHYGTHVDSPKHFFENGLTVDSYEPSFWIFNVVDVVFLKECYDCEIVMVEHVIPYLKNNTEMVLIKTGQGAKRNSIQYWKDNIGISPELGKKLRADYPSVRAVGIDTISISSWRNRELGRASHKAFLDPEGLNNPIIIIEDMDLSDLNDKTIINRIIVLPLRVKDGDGSPCSIIAEVIESD